MTKTRRTSKLKKARRSEVSKKLDAQKRCYTDEKMGEICHTGQYSTYEGNFYTNKRNVKLFQKIGEEFKKNPKYKHWKTVQEKYKQFLNQNFAQKQTTAKNIDLIKNNFYGYVNDVWLKELDIESGKKTYYVQHDDFRIKQEEVYYKLIGYVKKYIKENPNTAKGQAIKNVYESMTTNTMPKFKKHVHMVVEFVEKFIEKGDVYALLADLNKVEIVSWSSPIQWTMSPDEKNVKKYISHLTNGSLGIYDYLIYLEDPSDSGELKRYKSMVKREYLHYITELFKACLGAKEASAYKASDVWEVETELLLAMGCESSVKTDPNFYNKVSAQYLEKDIEFDWPHFAKLLGFKEIPREVVVSNLKSLKCVIKLLKEKWQTPAYKTFWLYIQFKQMIRFEDTLRVIHFNFYNKILEGQPAIMPSEIYPIFILSLLFNTFLSEQYLEHEYNALYVNYVKHLVGDLKELFIKKLQRNTWLSEETKTYALEKLQKLTIFVGSPGKLRYDPLFKYQKDDALANVGRLLSWKHKRYLALENKPVIDIPEFDWQAFKIVGTQCYMVNAYYRPISNSIYVPLAYLQKPFIDLEERGLEYNLVYIGYTLGHELSHALDNTGSKYDANGNLNNWWTDHDRKEFQKKVDDVVKQYELFAKRDGLEFDAEPAAGESLADISGYALIEEYLLDNQVINDEDVKLKKINLAKLYMNLAIQGRQKIYKKALKAQLKTNPHPPEVYRVNCPLSRLQLFRTIFGIKKGDGMWWHNTDTIW